MNRWTQLTLTRRDVGLREIDEDLKQIPAIGKFANLTPVFDVRLS